MLPAHGPTTGGRPWSVGAMVVVVGAVVVVVVVVVDGLALGADPADVRVGVRLRVEGLLAAPHVDRVDGAEVGETEVGPLLDGRVQPEQPVGHALVDGHAPRFAATK